MFTEHSKLPEMTFDIFRDRNVKRCDRDFPMCKDWTDGDWGNALAGEVGELCNLLKKLRRGEDIPISEIGKEIADVIIYADLIAARHGLDLREIIRDKFNEVSRRVNSPYFI